MPRFNRDTISRTIAELIGENSTQTYEKFEPRREHNDTTIAKLRIPEHQRFYVWGDNRKSPLIDSVMENCPLPLMVFTQHILGGRVVWFVQDGQQRLMTLQKFILGEFKWNNKTFDELSSEERRLFLSYKINCEIIDEPTPDQIADIFERLNCGKPLTDNDKFYNRRESPVVSFIKNELNKSLNNRMSFYKPSLYVAFKNAGDISEIIDLIDKYYYTDEEASEVINFYEPYENNYIPEVEHIEVLLTYFPKGEISNNTMNAIKNCFPDRVKPILELQNRHFTNV